MEYTHLLINLKTKAISLANYHNCAILENGELTYGGKDAFFKEKNKDGNDCINWLEKIIASDTRDDCRAAEIYVKDDHGYMHLIYLIPSYRGKA